MLNSPRVSLLLLAAVVILPSCAKEVEYDAYNTYPIYQYEEETLLTALKSAPLDVDYTLPSDAADKVGLIAMAAGPRNSLGQKLGQCSGFLIDRNIIATNSHCMTEEIMKSSDCSQNLAIKFRTVDSNGKNLYACKRVLKKSTLSEEELDQADWAFFEIEPTTRTPMKVSRTGISDETPIRSVRVDPKGNGLLGGTITQAECRTAQHSILNPSYTSEFSRTGVAVGCTVRQGNSGSPVFHALTGEVVGILQSYVTENYMKLINKKLQPIGMSYPSTPPSHFIFTNLSCVEDWSTGVNLNSGRCAEARLATSDARNEGAKRSLTEGLVRESSRWEASLPSVALYMISIFDDGLSLRATPFCLRPLKDWSAAVLSTKETEGYVIRDSRYRFPVDVSLKIKTKFSTDPALRLRQEVAVSSSTEMRYLTFTFRAEGSEIKASMSSIYGYDLPLEGFRWCTPEQIARGNLPDPTQVKAKP